MHQADGTGRRLFLQQVAAAAGVAGQAPPSTKAPGAASVNPAQTADIAFPRVFRGRQLAMIAFPLGGLAAGSLSLGGRGQLRDWEIFNKPNKGFSPPYAFPSIWAQAGSGKPVARVLESRILPPYEGANGLGSNNVPGLVRLDSAVFTGEYPMARIDFGDRALPVRVSLEAFSPFIPHDVDESGLPVAVLRYRATNPGAAAARVAIAFSIDNPVTAQGKAESRAVDHRAGESLEGLLMSNSGMDAADPMQGTFAFGVTGAADGKVTHLRGWHKSRWWNAPMLFWDDFSADGELGPEPAERGTVGSICLGRTIAPGKHADFTFVLAWNFPNRTPEWIGWHSEKGKEKTLIGNYYSTRFADAWAAAEHAAANLDKLEARTRQFVTAFRESTLPGAVKDAASANLSTLASTTTFRTADGEFHGWEGVNDKAGCCYGNCTHVWNYETTTHHVFPAMARSLRKASFGYSLDDAGAIHFRQVLPEGAGRSGFAAADGQMGQIMHAYYDWVQSGDNDWLRAMWPRIKKALEFAWIAGGWDGDRDGVLEGVQHNTYDVEFYGPNPMCGVYYLGALRACEEMARVIGDEESANEYKRLFEQGRRWIDGVLFNGEYYVQQVRGVAKDKIAPALLSDMGSTGTENPEYQVGEGCLVDQLLGQCMAEVTRLGPLLDQKNVKKALASIYRYNFKRSLANHNSVQRIFALNDEAALVVCDYGKAERPRIPFPYYAEVFTGLEYSTASHMIYAGLVGEGVECIRATRARYDGEKRNPWDEAECGHHYARAMSAWSGVLALSGFEYHGAREAVVASPRVSVRPFKSFWSTGTGWGTFSLAAGRFSLKVLAGKLPCRTCEVPLPKGDTVSKVNGKVLSHEATARAGRLIFLFCDTVVLDEGHELQFEVLNT
jgi:uncharacterized protein (DUF608 family)